MDTKIMIDREKDKKYLRMAKIWSENSYAIRRKVGCLIVSEKGFIISDGYNGTPRGFENVCECLVDDEKQRELEVWKDEIQRKILRKHQESGETLKTKPYVLHAEANALTKLIRHGISSEGSTLYCTDSPCLECAKLIIQSGVQRVVYEREYRVTDGVNLLRRAGVVVEVIPIKVIDTEETP